jgi:hypothetical protein
VGPRMAALAAALVAGILLLVLAAAPAKANTDSADGETLALPHDSVLLLLVSSDSVAVVSFLLACD